MVGVLGILGVLGHVGLDVGGVEGVMVHVVGVDANRKLGGTPPRLLRTLRMRNALAAVATRMLTRGSSTLPPARGTWRWAGRTVQSLWMHVRQLECRAGGQD